MKRFMRLRLLAGMALLLGLLGAVAIKQTALDLKLPKNIVYDAALQLEA